jgi:hypothetical protein
MKRRKPTDQQKFEWVVRAVQQFAKDWVRAQAQDNGRAADRAMNRMRKGAVAAFMLQRSINRAAGRCM